MSAGHRALVAALLISLGAAGTAHAQNPAARAKALNDEGKALLFASNPNYEAAANKFRQAIVLSPEGRFYFNLCVSLYQTGDFGNALMSCQAVEPNGASDAVKKNAADLIEKIKEQMKKQGMNPDAVPDNTHPPDNTNPDNTNPNNTNPDNTNPDNTNPNNTNPNNTNPNNTNPNNTNPGNNPNVAQFRGAPPPSLFTVVAPKHDYTYTFGAALVAGGASIGTPGAYGSTVAGVRLLGDLMFAPGPKIGGEGYIDLMNVPEGTDGLTRGMAVVDFGVGLYKHFCTGRICITPLGGAHIVAYAPGSNAGSGEDYASFGVRGQAQIGYAFGARYEHFVTLNLGADVDLKPLGNYTTPADMDFIGLDRGGALVMVSLGYQYRFNTPFGQSPFLQLE